MKALQDFYPDDLSHCFGCGRNNAEGHQLKSFWDSDRAVARFDPQPRHVAVPGFVYGGLIASLIDCHGTATAAAAAYRAEGRALGSEPPLRFVTASLKVDYLAPTPMGHSLHLEGVVVEAGARKVVIDVSLRAADRVCAEGRVVAVRLPETMLAGGHNPGRDVPRGSAR